MDRYARQRGLVAQDLVMDAEVEIRGTGPALPYLLQCLALTGVAARHGEIRLGLADRLVDAADIAGQFLLLPDDIGTPMTDALARRVRAIDPAIEIAPAGSQPARGLCVGVPAPGEEDAVARRGPVHIWGQVLPTAVYVGPEPVPGGAGPNVLSAALAGVCGGLAAQAVLGQLGALVAGPAALSSWLEERLWVRHPGIGRRAIETKLQLPALHGVLLDTAGEDASRAFRILHRGRPVDDAHITAVVDDDNVIVNVRLGPGTGDVTVAPYRLAPRPVRAMTWSPFASTDVRLPDRIPPSRIVMCGAGALGTWASAVLAASPSTGLELCIVDMDGTVEAHNLNRQVLYGPQDIGRAKAERAVERLAEINPDLRLRAVQTVVSAYNRDHFLGEATLLLDDELFAEQRRLFEEFGAALRDADAILSCPDNHQTRWVLNYMAERLGVPCVNGAMEGLVGRVHVCDPRDHGRCLVCWLGTSIALDPKRKSCTDVVGDTPVASIVTSAAIVGAVQAAALIAELTGNAAALNRFHALHGATDELVGYRAADRDSDECPAHLFDAQPDAQPIVEVMT